MYTLKNSKFETMVTEMFDRYANGAGFLKGDVVKLKDNVKSSDWYKKQSDTVKRILDGMTEKSNRVYRISTLKSEKPRAAGSFGIDEPVSSCADVVREVNPSFWVDPITVPLEYLEQIDTGINMPKYDKDLVRKDTTQADPKEKGKSTDKESADQTKVDDKERNLTDKNTKLEHGEKWDDSKPGASNTPKKFLRKDRRQKQAS